MPKINEERQGGDLYYLGLKRSEWVTQAARAIISSSDPELRFLILKGGFVHFERKTRIEMEENAGIKFTSAELRKIFEAIEWWCRKKGEHWKQWPLFELAYNRIRRGEKWRASDLRKQADLMRDIILTENANGRKQVH